MKFHPDILAAHAQFGGDLPSMQAIYDRPDHVARIAALEAQLAEASRLILYAADSFAAHAKVSDHPEEQCAYLDSEKMYRNYLSALEA